MEVEAKYTVADEETLERLALTPALAGYEVEAGEARHDHDIFLDTGDRRVLSAGYYLRRRETDDGVKITLKQLVTDEGGVLRREELEAMVAADVPLAEWPHGQLKKRVLELTGDAPLDPFLTLEQERVARRVFEGDREVAELSLDDVRVTVGDRENRWFEVEVELREEGRDDDLERLTAALAGEPGLAPESRAKFARALELTEGAGPAGSAPAGGSAAPAGRLLPAHERPLHEAFAAGDGPDARRAVALLALDDGLVAARAAERAGLSTRRVRYWAARYRVEGMAIYRDPPPQPAAASVAERRPRRIQRRRRSRLLRRPETCRSRPPRARTTTRRSGPGSSPPTP